MQNILLQANKHIPVILALAVSVFAGLFFACLAAVNPVILTAITFLAALVLTVLCIALYLLAGQAHVLYDFAIQYYLKMGVSFQRWFLANSLVWVSLAGFISTLLLLILERSQLALLMYAGFSAAAFFCWIGAFSSVFYSHQAQEQATLSLGWEREFHLKAASVWSFIENVFFLPARIEWAYTRDFLKALEIHRILDGVQISKEGPRFRPFWDVKPDFKLGLQEAFSRLPVLFVLFLITALLALLIPFYQLHQHIPPELSWVTSSSLGAQAQDPNGAENSQNEKSTPTAGNNNSASGQGPNDGPSGGGQSGSDPGGQGGAASNPGQGNGDSSSGGSGNGQQAGDGQGSGGSTGQGSSAGQQDGSSAGQGQQGNDPIGSGQGSDAGQQNGSSTGQGQQGNDPTGSGQGSTAGQQDGSSAGQGQQGSAPTGSEQDPGAGQQDGSSTGQGQQGSDPTGSGQGSSAGQPDGSSSGQGQQGSAPTGSGQDPGTGQPDGSSSGQGQQGSDPTGSGQDPNAGQQDGSSTGQGQQGNDPTGSGQGTSAGQQDGSSAGQGQQGNDPTGSGQGSGAGQQDGSSAGQGQQGSTQQDSGTGGGPGADSADSANDSTSGPPDPHKNPFTPPDPKHIFNIDIQEGGPLFGDTNLSQKPTPQPGILPSPYLAPIGQAQPGTQIESDSIIFQWIPNWIKYLFSK